MLTAAIEQKASDLHLTVGVAPTLRVNRKLLPLSDFPALKKEDTQRMVYEMLNEEQQDVLSSQRELDFSYNFKDQVRFRVNAFYQRDSLSAALRLIPSAVPDFEALGLPRKILADFCKLPQGFILITGAAGQGKSTTIASMVEQINTTRAERIITIEDPIEYVFEHKKSLVDQREMHSDTHSWGLALRSVLREDPNVIVIGEMRDYDTIASAITIAETGHLVFATLHTNSAAQTVDRIIDVFPAEQQRQVRVQLASILKGILCQRLIPSLDNKVTPAIEVLLGSPAVQSTIREGKTHQIQNIINTSLEIGMMSFEHSLADLVTEGKVSKETALSFSEQPGELARLLH
ncbi:MAG: type IV pilus twitching motility protein PilT [bacterium]